MSKLLLVDLDGTIRTRIDDNLISPLGTIPPGPGFVYRILPGAIESLQAYHNDGFTIFGITNQGGVATGDQTIRDCVLEQRHTIELTCGLIELVFFCPGDGRTAHVVDSDDTSMLKTRHDKIPDDPVLNYRKPALACCVTP